MNYLAGVDLLEKLIEEEKLSFKVLIYCSDVNYARENIRQRGL